MAPHFISSVSEKRHKDLPICPVCQEHFDNGDRIPKLFDCAHSVCAVCAEKLLEYRKFNAPYQPVTLSCPVCRITTNWSTSTGFRTNFGLKDAVLGFQKSEQKLVNIVECNGCKRQFDEKDIHICINCAFETENIDFRSMDNIPANYNLEKVSVCSTCVLHSHIGISHYRIPFQNIRVRHQLTTNFQKVTEQMSSFVENTNSSLSVLAQTTDLMKTSLQTTKQSVENFMKCGSSEEQEAKLMKIFKEISVVTNFLNKIESSCSVLNKELKNDFQKLNSESSMDIIELKRRVSSNPRVEQNQPQENAPVHHEMDLFWQ